MSVSLLAPEARCIIIIKAKSINPYERILKACIEVESHGNIFAYNEKEDAAGILQIRPIKLRQYFIETGLHYKLSDCFNPAVSKKIFMHFASQFNSGDNEKIARDWNKSKTDHYWKLVKAKL